MRLVLLLTLGLASCTPDPTPPETPAPPPAASSVDDTVVGIVGSTSQLATLRQAIDASGQAEALRNPDAAYTLFAPSDAAFRALSDADRAALLASPDRLAALLDAHTIPTRMLSPDIFDGLAIESVAGSMLDLASDGATTTVRDASGTTATITTPDLDSSNGVVHVIDTVLSY